MLRYLIFWLLFHVKRCFGGCFTLDLVSDSYFKETTWALKSWETGATLQSGDYFGLQECFFTDECVFLEIYDSHNDGFCCEYGRGFAKVYSDDELVWSHDGKFENIAISEKLCPGNSTAAAVNVDKSRRNQCLTMGITHLDGSDETQISYSIKSITNEILKTGSESFTECIYITDLSHITIVDSGLEGDAQISIYLGGQLHQQLSNFISPVTMEVSPLQNCISLDIVPDVYTARETSWVLIDDATGNRLLASEALESEGTITNLDCYPIADCVTLIFFDNGLDGICCYYGDGHAQVSFNDFAIGVIDTFSQSVDLRICASDYENYGARCYADKEPGYLAGCVESGCQSYDHKWEALERCVANPRCGGITWDSTCDPCNYQLRVSTEVKESEIGESSIRIIPCPADAVHGGFSQWSEWSDCTVGAEESFRMRACQEPEPTNGGHSCFGEYIQEKDCEETPNVPSSPRPTTGSCLKFRVTPDNYAFETSWDVRDANGIVLTSGKLDRYDEYGGIEECFYLAPSECVYLTVYDSMGDGLCCAHGEGDIKVYVDGVLVWDPENLEFGGSIWQQLCSDQQPVSTLEPEKCISMIIVPDQFPNEISWEIESVGTGSIVATGINATNLECFDISSEDPDGVCIILKDSGSNGFCCESGLGYYEIYAGSNLVVHQDGNFTNEIRHCIKPDDYVPPETVCVDLVILPDEYFNELDWKIESMSGELLAFGEGSNKYTGFTCYEISDSCIYITVEDCEGDGIPGGAINIYVDGKITYQNLNFDGFEDKQLVCPSDGDDDPIDAEDCVYLHIVPDAYAHQETTWIIRNNNGKLLAAGDYTGLTTCTVEMTDDCIVLEMYDSRNDGLCCDYGEGSFTLAVGNITVIQNNGQFQNGDTFSACPDDYGAPSVAPSYVPTFVPEGPCLNVSIVPDAYGHDISWKLMSVRSGRSILESDDENNDVGFECYPVAECLRFEIYDDDGICCRYGFGYYDAYLDATQFYHGDGEFLISDNFTVCPNDVPTPVDNPVCLQVLITPDAYPTETSWDVQYSDLNKILHSGYHVSVFDTTLVTEECLEVERGRCITVTLYDNDGFCCGYGQGQYKITYGGAVYAYKNATFPHGEASAEIEFCPDDFDCTMTTTGIQCINNPTQSPSIAPTRSTYKPTGTPSINPTYTSPSNIPSRSPIIGTDRPTKRPTDGTDNPSLSPTLSPETVPTTMPTSSPTNEPSSAPSFAPTHEPTSPPSNPPTQTPTDFFCGGYMGDDLNPDNFRSAMSLINAGAVVFDTRSELEVARTGHYPGAYNIYYPNFEGLDLSPYLHGQDDGRPIVLYGDLNTEIAYDHVIASGFTCVTYLTDWTRFPDWPDWTDECILEDYVRDYLVKSGISQEILELLCIRDGEYFVNDFPTCIAFGFWDEGCDIAQFVCAGQDGYTYGTVDQHVPFLNSLLESNIWEHEDCPTLPSLEDEKSWISEIISTPISEIRGGDFNISVDSSITWVSELPLPYEFIEEDLEIIVPHLEGKIVNYDVDITSCEIDYDDSVCRQEITLNFTTKFTCDISGDYTFNLYARPNNFVAPDILKTETFTVGATPACAHDFGELSLFGTLELFGDAEYSIPQSTFAEWSQIYMRVFAYSPYRQISDADIEALELTQPGYDVFHEMWKENGPVMWGKQANLTIDSYPSNGGLNIDVSFNLYSDEIIVTDEGVTMSLCVEYKVIYEEDRRLLLTEGVYDNKRSCSNGFTVVTTDSLASEQTQNNSTDNSPLAALFIVLCTILLLAIMWLGYIYYQKKKTQFTFQSDIQYDISTIQT